MTPSKQKHSLTLTAHISRTTFLCLIRDVVMKRAKVGSKTILASKLKGKYGNDNKEMYFVDEIYSSAGHK